MAQSPRGLATCSAAAAQRARIDPHPRGPSHWARPLRARTGIGLAEEEGTLQMLVAAGQASWTGSHYSPNAIPALDMRKEPKLVEHQRAFWAKVASERAPTTPNSVCAYNIFTISHEGYQQLKILQREFLQKARAIIGNAHPDERVALLQLNLVPFDGLPSDP